MPETSIEDRAAHIYYACNEIAVAPNGPLWDVLDGPNGPRVDTVDAEVLQYLEDNYDMPVDTVDGDAWRP